MDKGFGTIHNDPLT